MTMRHKGGRGMSPTALENINRHNMDSDHEKFWSQFEYEKTTFWALKR